jgi:hypothetical protein
VREEPVEVRPKHEFEVLKEFKKDDLKTIRVAKFRVDMPTGECQPISGKGGGRERHLMSDTARRHLLVEPTGFGLDGAQLFAMALDGQVCLRFRLGTGASRLLQGDDRPPESVELSEPILEQGCCLVRDGPDFLRFGDIGPKHA